MGLNVGVHRFAKRRPHNAGATSLINGVLSLGQEFLLLQCNCTCLQQAKKADGPKTHLTKSPLSPIAKNPGLGALVLDQQVKATTIGVIAGSDECLNCPCGESV